MKIHFNLALIDGSGNSLNKSGLRKFLQREILTDESLATYGQKIGVRYRLGTLTESLPHLEQLFLHGKWMLFPCSRADDGEAAFV